MESLRYPLTARTVHLCIDMQRIFSEDGIWPTPWIERVLPVVTELAARHPRRTVFTRFITPARPEDMPGLWQRYYRRWRSATRPGASLMRRLRSATAPTDMVAPRLVGWPQVPLIMHGKSEAAPRVVLNLHENLDQRKPLGDASVRSVMS